MLSLFAKPDEDILSCFVYVRHELDLLASLVYVRLIDTESIATEGRTSKSLLVLLADPWACGSLDEPWLSSAE